MGCRSLRRGGVIAGAGEMQPPEDFCRTFPVRLASQGGHTVGGQWNIGQISVLEIIEV